MITYIIELVLAILLVLIIMNFFKKRPKALPPTAVPQIDLGSLRVTDARTGDVLSVAGVGDNMNDLDFTVDRTTQFQAGPRSWRELSGMYRDRRVVLRVANDEEVEAAIHAAPRKLTVKDLGVGEDDLAQMDERRTPAIRSSSITGWQYRLSRDTQARRRSAAAQQLYYWEFREQDGGSLAIRKPEGEPFAVTRYLGIPQETRIRKA
jgi:hypothetical protein